MLSTMLRSHQSRQISSLVTWLPLINYKFERNFHSLISSRSFKSNTPQGWFTEGPRAQSGLSWALLCLKLRLLSQVEWKCWCLAKIHLWSSFWCSGPSGRFSLPRWLFFFAVSRKQRSTSPRSGRTLAPLLRHLDVYTKPTFFETPCMKTIAQIYNSKTKTLFESNF